MGRKKKRAAPDPMSRIFCYYCDRTFASEQMLLMHQREKHLRCPTCNKRMLSVASMVIHSSQMHNADVASVPNALPARASVAVDVLGMKGIPDAYYAALRREHEPQPPLKHHRHDAPPPQQYAVAHAQLHPPSHPAQPQLQPPYAAQHYYAQPDYPPQQYPPQHATQYPPAQYPYQPHQPYAPYQQPAQPYPPAPYYAAHPPPQQPYVPVRHSAAPASAPAQAAHQAAPDALAAAAVGTPEAIAQPPVAAEPTTKVVVAQPADQVKIVFARKDVSMEELRAELPRYRIN